MEKDKDYLEYVEKTEIKKIQEENGLEDDEILLPGFLSVEPVEEDDIEFIMLPAGKYEMLISSKVLRRYWRCSNETD